MGPLVAIGGVHVPGSIAGALEKKLDTLCYEFGFPAGEPFKWSPGRKLWMRKKLVGANRVAFMNAVLMEAKSHSVTALVVLEDTLRNRVTDAEMPEEDVTRLFLERIQMGSVRSQG